MSTKSIISIFFIAFFSIVLMSNRSGRAASSGNGATTAPGENGQYCGSIGCHFNGSFSPEASLVLLDQNNTPTDMYIPGQQYTIVLDATIVGNPAGFGFQIVGLRHLDNSGIMGFTNFPNRVRQTILGDRQYVEHSNIIDMKPIELDWIAPDEGTGDIDFYAALNVVNGNGSTSGDGADTVSFSIKEDLTSAINHEQLLSGSLKIWPNPAVGFLNIDSDYEILRIELLNLSGQIVSSKLYYSGSTLDLSNLDSGIYIVKAKLKTGNVLVQKLVIN